MFGADHIDRPASSDHAAHDKDRARGTEVDRAWAVTKSRRTIALGHQLFLASSYEDKKGRVARQWRRRYASEQRRQP
jgi:hypothetical protein